MQVPPGEGDVRRSRSRRKQVVLSSYHIAGGFFLFVAVALATISLLLASGRAIFFEPYAGAGFTWAGVIVAVVVLSYNRLVLMVGSIVVAVVCATVAILGSFTDLIADIPFAGILDHLTSPALPGSSALLAFAAAAVVCEKRFMHQLIFPPAAFFGIALFAVCGLEALPTSLTEAPPSRPKITEIEGHKVLVNRDYNVQLPEEWEVIPPTETADAEATALEIVMLRSDDTRVEVSIRSEDLPEAFDVDKRAREEMARAKEERPKVSVIVSDYPAVPGAKNVLALEGTETEETILLPRRTKLYVIEVRGPRDAIKSHRESIDGIVQSFELKE